MTDVEAQRALLHISVWMGGLQYRLKTDIEHGRILYAKIVPFLGDDSALGIVMSTIKYCLERFLETGMRTEQDALLDTLSAYARRRASDMLDGGRLRD